jgi:hypothetical protein
LLDRAEKSGTAPRIFYTNGAYEYYGRAASLIHTTLTAHATRAVREGTRIYFVAGSQHGPATAFPPQRTTTQQFTSSNDYRWAMRALLLGMQRWIAEDKPPPASAYPRIAEHQLVSLESVRFPKIPGVSFPTRMHNAFALDYGPEFRTQGIVSTSRQRWVRRYPAVSRRSIADGNETSGLRMPGCRFRSRLTPDGISARPPSAHPKSFSASPAQRCPSPKPRRSGAIG